MKILKNLPKSSIQKKKNPTTVTVNDLNYFEHPDFLS